MVISVSQIASIITIMTAVLGFYRFRKKILMLFRFLMPIGKHVGIIYIHKNRKKAIEKLLPALLKSSQIKTMSLKGYPLVLEPDSVNTLLFKLIEEGNREMKVDMLIYYPDSEALNKRKEELGDKFSQCDFQKDIEESIRKIDSVNKKFGDRVNLRFFCEPRALWNIVIWDQGMLVGWYEPKIPGHNEKSPYVEIRKGSILWNQFIKYFDNTWKFRSISKKAHFTFKGVFPHSDSYSIFIFKNEPKLVEYFSRSPDNKNAFVIYIGGGAAGGKSSIAWEIAKIIGIRNIISTDMVLQVSRQYNQARELQMETWDLWRLVGETCNNETLYKGLEMQTILIEPMLISLAEFALSKGMTTILEGIHILPKSKLSKNIKQENQVLFFIDASEERIRENYNLRRISTHMRKTGQGFVNIDKRIILHNQIIRNACEEGQIVIRDDNWGRLLDKALEIVFNHINKK
jgi:2-phosphoglycerate kinase